MKSAVDTTLHQHPTVEEVDLLQMFCFNVVGGG